MEHGIAFVGSSERLVARSRSFFFTLPAVDSRLRYVVIRLAKPEDARTR